MFVVIAIHKSILSAVCIFKLLFFLCSVFIDIGFQFLGHNLNFVLFVGLHSFISLLEINRFPQNLRIAINNLKSLHDNSNDLILPNTFIIREHSIASNWNKR